MSDTKIKIRDGLSGLHDMAFDTGSAGLVPYHKITGAVDLSRGDSAINPLFVTGAIDVNTSIVDIITVTASYANPVAVTLLSSDLNKLSGSVDLVSASVQTLIPYLTDISSSVSSSAAGTIPYLINISSSVSGTIPYISEVSSSVSGTIPYLINISSSVSGTVPYLTGISSSVSGTIPYLIDISASTTQGGSYLSSISSSASDISSSLSVNTEYTKEIYKFSRATEFFSTLITGSALSSSVDLFELEALNPGVPDIANKEAFILKAIEAVIQNSTNKNVYLKIGYDELNAASPTNYSIKIPPGVIYTSESKYAHMRHKVLPETTTGLNGEIAASIAYNTNLLPELSVGIGPLTSSVFSLATNEFNISDTTPRLVGEFAYFGGLSFTSFKVIGQGRVTSGGQELHLYVVDDSAPTVRLATQNITSTTPVEFELIVASPTPPVDGHTYSLLASGSAGITIGDVRVLFADVVKYV
jgi:hypothetical protein